MSVITSPLSDGPMRTTNSFTRREGDYYIVNGLKKWITGGAQGDFFTTAVRTGEDGVGGISLLLLERGMPGMSIRKMKTQFDTAHSTTFITLDDVKVRPSGPVMSWAQW